MSFEPNGWVWRCPESPSAMVRGEQLDLSPTSGDSGSPALPLPKHLWIVPRAVFCLFYCAFLRGFCIKTEERESFLPPNREKGEFKVHQDFQEKLVQR